VIEAFSAVRFRLSARGKEKFDKFHPAAAFNHWERVEMPLF
jgi:hypothetical protein